jgi:hypothetical protein
MRRAMELLEKRKNKEMGGDIVSPERQSTPERGNANPMYQPKPSRKSGMVPKTTSSKARSIAGSSTQFDSS